MIIPHALFCLATERTDETIHNTHIIRYAYKFMRIYLYSVFMTYFHAINCTFSMTSVLNISINQSIDLIDAALS